MRFTKGEDRPVQPRPWHLLILLTGGFAWALVAIAGVCVYLADLLLLDTHHFTFSVHPKWGDNDDRA